MFLLDSVKYFILLYFYTTTFDVAFSSAGACNSKPLVFEHMSMQLQTSCFLTHEHTTPNLLFFNTWACNSKPLFSQVAQVVFLSETFPKPRRYLQDWKTICSSCNANLDFFSKMQDSSNIVFEFFYKVWAYFHIYFQTNPMWAHSNMSL